MVWKASQDPKQGFARHGNLWCRASTQAVQQGAMPALLAPQLPEVMPVAGSGTSSLALSGQSVSVQADSTPSARQPASKVGHCTCRSLRCSPDQPTNVLTASRRPAIHFLSHLPEPHLSKPVHVVTRRIIVGHAKAQSNFSPPASRGPA